METELTRGCCRGGGIAKKKRKELKTFRQREARKVAASTTEQQQKHQRQPEVSETNKLKRFKYSRPLRGGEHVTDQLMRYMTCTGLSRQLLLFPVNKYSR